jgi:UDP-2,3-diacylglucosamine pyrophosphatase LpxH
VIIAVSDVHLCEHADDKSAKEDDIQFSNFLDHIKAHQLKDGGDLVLVGDIVDYWRRGFAKPILESAGIISKLRDFDGRVKKYYVVGNHDYYSWNLSGLIKDWFPFEKVDKHIRLAYGGKAFFFIHGYQMKMSINPYYNSLFAYEAFSEILSLQGEYAGRTASSFWEKIEEGTSIIQMLKGAPHDIKGAMQSMLSPPDKRLNGVHNAKEKIKGFASSKNAFEMGLEENDILVYGHTHEPFQADDGSVINIGSWKKSPCKDYTYLEIINGKPTLMKFEDGACKKLFA